MPVVAGEELVAPVAGQRHGDLGAGQPADQVHRDLGDVAERLVPEVRKVGNDVLGVPVADPQQGVVGTEVIGHGGGFARLVERPVGEADGERPHRTIAVPLHQGDDQARIDPAGEEGADRHVGHHPGGHRVGQRRLQLVGHLLGGSGDGVGSRPLDGVTCRPVGTGRRKVAGPVRWAEGDQLPGKEFGRAPVDGVRGGDAVVPEVQGDRVAVDPGVELRAGCGATSTPRRRPAVDRPSRSRGAFRRSGPGPGAAGRAAGPTGRGRTFPHRRRGPRRGPRSGRRRAGPRCRIRPGRRGPRR